MPHNVKSRQRIKIIAVEIAVPANADEGEVADTISALLTENGICVYDNAKGDDKREPIILDWRYRPKRGNKQQDFEGAPIVIAPRKPNEGEIFRMRSIKQRLEYLRGELRAERISYGELHELQSLASHIDKDDPELLEAAGVPEKQYRKRS